MSGTGTGRGGRRLSDTQQTGARQRLRAFLAQVAPRPTPSCSAGPARRDGRAAPDGATLAGQTGDELGGRHALSAGQVAAYQRDGHLHIPAVLSPSECAQLRAAVGEAVQQTAMAESMAVPMADREPKAFSRIFAQVRVPRFPSPFPSNCSRR